MYGVADYGAFVLAVIVFLAVPGPGNLALLTSTAKGGVRGGLAAACGVILADQILMWLAVGGVAALLRASPLLFGGIQWLGAGYLVWLGLRMLFARADSAPVVNITAGHYLRQAMAITLLNPKAIIFYMAFFPLFVDPAQHRGLPTFAFMAGTIASLTLIYCLLAISLARFLAAYISARPSIPRRLERLAGTLLIGFGIRLISSH